MEKNSIFRDSDSPEEILESIRLIRKEKGICPLLQEVLAEFENGLREKVEPKIKEAIKQTEEGTDKNVLQDILDALENNNFEDLLELLKKHGIKHEVQGVQRERKIKL